MRSEDVNEGRQSGRALSKNLPDPRLAYRNATISAPFPADSFPFSLAVRFLALCHFGFLFLSTSLLSNPFRYASA